MKRPTKKDPPKPKRARAAAAAPSKDDLAIAAARKTRLRLHAEAKGLVREHIKGAGLNGVISTSEDLRQLYDHVFAYLLYAALREEQHRTWTPEAPASEPPPPPSSPRVLQ